MENENESRVVETGGTVHTVTGHLRIMQTVNKKLYRVELWMLNDQVNRNGWKYINLAEHLSEFLNIPILTAYVNGGRKIGDGHNFDLRIDPETGKEYASFTDADAERIVGWLPQDANVRIETEEDGTNWIVGTGYLWRWYSKELVDKIARQGSGMEISIETLVTEMYMDGNTEVEVKWSVLGVTVLGDGVVPAVAGANIQSLATLSAVRSGMRDFILRAASYENEPQEPQNNNEKGVKKPMRISKSRLNALGAKFGEGYTLVGVSEDECRVALLNANNEFFGYSFAESDSGTVIPERIASANASVTFRYNGEEVEADLDSVIGVVTQKVRGLEAENETLNESVNTLSAQIAAMQSREKARRLQAAKDAMNDQFREINSVRSKADRFDEDLLKALSARVDAGEFTDMEDKDGNWIGDANVRKEVKVLCADADTEQRAKNRKIIYGERLNAHVEKNSPKTIGDLLSADADE